jgi:dienelactone hydrolase
MLVQWSPGAPSKAAVATAAAREFDHAFGKIAQLPRSTSMSKLHHLILSTLIASAALRAGDADACTLPSGAAVHRYWQQTVFYMGQPANPDRCTYSSGWKCHLSGWLYTPTGTTGSNLPALVFVHGSGGNWSAGLAQSQRGECEMINYYVSRGYVVWAPVMRGVADDTFGATPDLTFANSTSAGFANTGTYVGDWATQQSDPSSPNYGWYTAAMPGWGVTSPTYGDYLALTTLEYMDEEVDDIQLALTYLVGLAGTSGAGKLVDPNKIAISGHSYGGATIVLASSHTLSPQPKAVINMSGGVLSWAGSVIWNNVLTYYAAQHKQALMSRLNNSESSTGDYTPGEAIYNAASASGSGGAALKKYGTGSTLQALCASNNTNQCYHTEFQTDSTQVTRWAPDVLDYLIANGVQ